MVDLITIHKKPVYFVKVATHESMHNNRLVVYATFTERVRRSHLIYSTFGFGLHSFHGCSSHHFALPAANL